MLVSITFGVLVGGPAGMVDATSMPSGCGLPTSSFRCRNWPRLLLLIYLFPTRRLKTAFGP